MSTPVSSIHAAAQTTAADDPNAAQRFARMLEMLTSDKSLRLAAIAGLVFLAWKALRGLRSLFWVAFGVAWVLFWTQGSRGF